MNNKRVDVITLTKYLTGICLGIYLVGCSGGQSNIIGEEEYEVYEIVFDSLYKDAEPIVILNNTLRDTSEIHPSYLEDSTYKAYHMKNERSFALDVDRFNGKERNYTLISYKEYETILKQKDAHLWDNFYAVFPHSNGLFKLSRVGFNQDTTKALLKIANIRGELSGGIFMVTLSRVDNQWRVEEKYTDALF